MILKNKALFASAGTGKTYQLTNRFIQILHHTEKPERIIALTFTRASAGEFFNKIIEKLYLAACSEKSARDLSKALDIKADSSRYAFLMGMMLKRLHKHNLQTLDSFLYKITTAFSTDLGIPESVQLLSENATKHYQKIISDRIIYKLNHSSEGETIIKSFWDAFKNSNYGEQKRSIEKTLSKYIEEQHQLFLDAPNEIKWGNFKYIWGTSLEWFQNKNFDWQELSKKLSKAIPKDSKGRELNTYLTATKDISAFPKTLKYNSFLSRCIQNYEAIFSGKARIPIYNKNILIEGVFCKVLSECIQAIISFYIKRSLQCAHGTYKVMEIYDREYEQLVRKKGKLTFSDILCFLNSEANNSNFNLKDPAVRSLIDFRLDAQFDHWLFDEFQDTSRKQWQIIVNLIDEVLQDPTNQRSVYFVGDTKQSLYLWRSSDDRLYQEICEKYKDNIEQPAPLTESYRSSPAIMEAVNAVFDQAKIMETHFGHTVTSRWKKAWKPHFSNPSLSNEEGFATWIDVNSWENFNEETCILKILKNLEPKLEHLSVGILVRKNDEVLSLAHFLREQNLKFPIKIGSSQKPAKDTSVGVTLIAMLKYCTFPSDSATKALLGLIDTSTSGPNLIQRVDTLRPQANALTFDALLLAFSETILEKIETQDARHKDYLRMLIEESRSFQMEEQSNLSDLISFLENYQFNASNTKSQITIETIHRSKGLEYDAIILINNDKRISTKQRIQARRDEKQSIQWILEPFKKEIMQVLPEVCDLQDQIAEQEYYSALCKLYVGMTRAKKALYMVNNLKSPNKNTALAYLKDCLGETHQDIELFDSAKFPVLWQNGNRHWHLSIASNTNPKDELDANSPKLNYHPTHKRLKTISPSKLKLTKKLKNLLGKQSHAIQFGEQVHFGFQQIDWYESNKQIDTLLNTLPHALAKKSLLECFSQKPIQDLFLRKSDKVELWKEKSFSYTEDHVLINGTFDRVHLLKDSNGNYSKATLIDFKTDFIAEGQSLEQTAHKHQEQIDLYQKVLSKLIQLDPCHIERVILFTHVKALYYFPACADRDG
jgi:ATP-dependent helicase/nuclease subunit A